MSKCFVCEEGDKTVQCTDENDYKLTMVIEFRK